MDKLKQWLLLTGLGCLVLLVAGWFLVVSPKRSEAADLRDSAEQQRNANALLETQLQVLQARAKDLPKEQAKLAAVSAKIPADPALPSLVRALLGAATESGVELVSIAPGEPQLVTPTTPTTPTAPATPAPPAQGQQAPSAGNTPAPAAGAADTAGQLATLPVAINVVGDYFEVQQFFAELEELPRALLVNSLDIAPGASPTARDVTADAVKQGRSLTTTIEATVFLAVNRPAPVVAAAPADAAAATPVTPTPTAGTQEPAR